MKCLAAIICLLALSASTRADGLLGAQIYAPEYASADYYAYPKYAFEYAVRDPKTGDNKAQWEKRDGDVVIGAYSLVEPDGSIRVVEYKADDKTGFNAIVKRIGPNIHPVTLPLYKAPLPIVGYKSELPISIGPIAGIDKLAGAPLLSGVATSTASLYKVPTTSIIKEVLPSPIIKEPLISLPLLKQPIVPLPIIKEPILPYPNLKESILPYPIIKETNLPYPIINKPLPIIKEPIVPYPNIKESILPYLNIKDPISILNERIPIIKEPIIPYPNIKDSLLPYPIIKDPISLLKERIPLIKEPINPYSREAILPYPITKGPIIQYPSIKEPILPYPIIKRPLIPYPNIKEPIYPGPIIKSPIWTGEYGQIKPLQPSYSVIKGPLYNIGDIDLLGKGL